MNRLKSKKLDKLRLYERLLNASKAFRVFFYAYGIAAFADWFFNCLEYDWTYKLDFLFIPAIWLRDNILNNESGTDFSLVVLSCISLGIGVLLDFLYNKNIENLFDEIDAEEERLEKEAAAKREELRNKKLARNAAKKKKAAIKHKIESVNSKLLFLIVPNVSKIRHSKTDKDLTFCDIDNYKREINEKLKKILSFSNPERKGYYKNNIFLLFKDFNYTDEFISCLKPTVDEIIPEYKESGIKVGFCYVFNIVESVDEKILAKELDSMDTVLSLKFVDEYITTKRFKDAYSNLSVRANKLELKGEYNLSKNLSVSKKQALYKIEIQNDGEK